ncbi:MAG TPA: ribosome maturation factor RimP [Myxococcaceae bacterium]|nr:ribosome maturation factor RimP [Myxococcaceae bacterium]
MPEQSRKQMIEARARELAEPLIAEQGMELVDVEYLREHDRWVLRLIIDRANGVGLEDCASVSHLVESVIDAQDLVDHEYHLEISSPGLDRPLKKPDHFRRVEGKKVRVKTFGPLGQPPRRNFSGLLKGVAEDAVTVEVEGAGAFRIPFKDIAKANLEFEFKH